jgi:uncharacterized protein with NRDE domain
MCLLALFYRVVEDAPVIAGANREEYYQRGGEPPRVLDGAARAVAGIDPVGGGTWFGVNEHGVLVAVTNRRKTNVPARPPSRGRLVCSLLAMPSAAEAADRAVKELEQDCYAGCNLVCADAERAVVIHAGDWLRVRSLPPGLHVLTNGDLNDATDRRLGYVSNWLRQFHYRIADDCVTALKQVCAAHEPEGSPVCFRLAERGTMSSSIVGLRRPLNRSTYLHAQGPPDRVTYEDYTHLIRSLGS